MKKQLRNVGILTALSLLLVGCDTSKESPKAKETPKEDLKLIGLRVYSQFTLSPYDQKFTLTENDSLYRLSENKATYSLKLNNNFDDQVINDGKEVNTMPNTESGEYAHIAITSDSTIQHSYKSYINGQPLITDLTLPITFVEGSFKEYQNKKRCVVKHTPEGVEKLEKEFSWQILLELTPLASRMFNEYGYKKITLDNKEPENVKNYVLKDNYKVMKRELPEPLLTFENGLCTYKNPTQTTYEIDFSGDFLLKK